MALTKKTMALIRLRKTPYSGLLSFLQDVFYKQELLADKALNLLKIIYQEGFDASDWKKIVKLLFSVKEPTQADDGVIDKACIDHLGFHRQNIRASKTKLRGKKVYKKLLDNEKVPDEVKVVLKRVSSWNSAVTSYYSILNKLKALGLVEKASGAYVKSEKFKRRLSQVLSLIEGFETEVTEH
jgi:hypothetical protein